MKKREAKEIAKDVLQHHLGSAYYSLYESSLYEYLSEEEQDMINEELDKLAKRMLKTIGMEYYTY